MSNLSYPFNKQDILSEIYSTTDLDALKHHETGLKMDPRVFLAYIFKRAPFRSSLTIQQRDSLMLDPSLVQALLGSWAAQDYASVVNHRKQ